MLHGWRNKEKDHSNHQLTGETISDEIDIQSLNQARN